MLWVIFAMIYLVTFVDMLLQAVQSELVPYVTSAFNSHGLLSTTSIVSTIMGGVSKLTIAKVIDIWGRAQVFAIMLLLFILGMIMKATCQNVETYAAAQTLFWVGHFGLLYTLDIIIADMTSLKNRIIMIGISTTPTIATTFAGPKIAELFYNNVKFRWAFGSLAIILAGVSVPMFVIFVLEESKAMKVGILVKKDNGRSIWQSCQFYFWEFDVIGMLLSMAGFVLTLLPFSLAQSFPKGWADAGPICMIVFGVMSLVLFALWEKYFARVSYLPFKFLKDRTILGASITYGVMFISIFCWDTYYSSYLQVVHNLSISHSGYILNSYSLMTSFLSPFVGVAIAQF
ncbi:hypothetical protein FJTKL_08579 [Diaporthe vaccinii]|uniref:Siderophore iron transporter n=1 Tax=Diaporthe vaccinii TaxID=105482 RepID=A0ABR4ERJ4_9PEZI